MTMYIIYNTYIAYFFYPAHASHCGIHTHTHTQHKHTHTHSECYKQKLRQQFWCLLFCNDYFSKKSLLRI